MTTKKPPGPKGSGISARDEWVRALGRLPPDSKAQFISQAEKVLQQARNARAPTPDDKRSLLDVADRADSLSKALKRAKRLPLPNAYLRNAWKELGSQGHTPSSLAVFPEDLPAAIEVLSAAARLWATPHEHRAGGRPVDLGPAPMAIVVLTGLYETVFGESPAYGTGSPFVKFCEIAFPAFGFPAPSKAKLRKPIG